MQPPLMIRLGNGIIEGGRRKREDSPDEIAVHKLKHQFITVSIAIANDLILYDARLNGK